MPDLDPNCLQKLHISTYHTSKMDFAFWDMKTLFFANSNAVVNIT